MQLFCPSCQAAYFGASRCPRCGGLLLMPQEATVQPRRRHTGYEPIRPTQTARVIVGLVLALGAYLGLRQFATGLVLAAEPNPEAWWLSFDGLRVVFGLQATAAVFGALLAGAGRPRGFVLGAAVGGLCGLAFLAVEVAGGAPPLNPVLLVQVAVLLGAGAVAGVVGARVWPTPPDVEMPVPASPNKLSSIQLDVNQARLKNRPTRWVRVLVAGVVIAAGVTTAEAARHGAQKHSAGMLHVESQGQGRFLSLQMAVLVILAGAGFAGAGTGAGIRHGLFAGFLGGVGVVALGAATGDVASPVAYWLERVRLHGAGLLDPAAAGAVVGAVILAGAVGGWLGGTLFLPLAPASLRNRTFRFGGD